jgi:hypothetical protein
MHLRLDGARREDVFELFGLGTDLVLELRGVVRHQDGSSGSGAGSLADFRGV